MTIFVTSDLHLNHRNILKYCPHRGGPEISDELLIKMNEKIIGNWNSDIAIDDEVFIIGDVCMGQMIHAPGFIRRLNGKKHLILGNHDQGLRKLMKSDESTSDLFESVHQHYELTYKFDTTKNLICMCHYPMKFWNRMESGSIHLFGHLHGAPHGIEGRCKDVGMDTNNLHAYKLDDVIEEMLKIEVKGNHHGE